MSDRTGYLPPTILRAAKLDAPTFPIVLECWQKSVRFVTIRVFDREMDKQMN